MLRVPVPGRFFVVPPDCVPYSPSVYHLVWDIPSPSDDDRADADGDGEPDYGILCQPRERSNEQLVHGTPDALPDDFTLCQNCQRRLHPAVTIPDDITPDQDPDTD